MTLSTGNNTPASGLKQHQTQSATDLSPRDGLGVALIDSGAPSIDIPPASARSLADALNTTFNEDDGTLGNVPCSLGQQGMSLNFGFNNDNAAIRVPLELVMLPDQSGQASRGADCFLPVAATNDLVTLGSPFMQAAYIVFDMDAQQLLMAQATMNATETDVQEYTAFMSRRSN